MSVLLLKLLYSLPVVPCPLLSSLGSLFFSVLPDHTRNMCRRNRSSLPFFRALFPILVCFRHVRLFARLAAAVSRYLGDLPLILGYFPFLAFPLHDLQEFVGAVRSLAPLIQSLDPMFVLWWTKTLLASLYPHIPYSRVPSLPRHDLVKIFFFQIFEKVALNLREPIVKTQPMIHSERLGHIHRELIFVEFVLDSGESSQADAQPWFTLVLSTTVSRSYHALDIRFDQFSQAGCLPFYAVSYGKLHFLALRRIDS